MIRSAGSLADAATNRDENEAVLSFQKALPKISTSNCGGLRTASAPALLWQYGRREASLELPRRSSDRLALERSIAAVMTTPGARREMLQIAIAYERLVERAERATGGKGTHEPP